MAPHARVLCVGGTDAVAVAPDVLAGAESAFDVHTVTDASERLDELASASVDCAVLDARGPESDALDRLSTLTAWSSEVPVVVLVDDARGADAPTIAKQALDGGAAAVLRASDLAAEPDLLVHRVTAEVEHRQRDRDLDQYRGLVSTVGDPMYVLDPDGTITFTNDAMVAMLGCESGDVVGQHASETMSAGDFERGTALIAEILEDGDRDWGTFEVTVQPVEGDPIPAEINVAPLLDDSGTYEATVGVVRDISDRKRREQRLAALHDTTRRLIEAGDVDEALSIGVEAAAEVLDLEMATFFRPTDDGDVLTPAARTAGVHEVLGDLPDFEPGDGLIWRAFEDGAPIFADDVTEWPETYNAETPIGSEMVIPADDHGVFVASSTDTEGFSATDEELAGVLVANLSRAIDSLRREANLRERERELEQYETIVRAIPDEVYTLDSEGYFTSIVPPTGSTLTTTGYEPTELVGEHVSAVMDEADVEAGETAIREVLAAEGDDRASFEMEVETRSGERIPNENHVALLTDGEEFRGTVGVLRDITDRKAREQALERQNERLERFAHIASHDLRNPLNVAAGRLELARADCESDHLDHLETALDRMETLIDDTLTMATEGEAVTDFEPVAVDDLAVCCWDAVPDDRATLAVRDQVTVKADPDRVRRVLENLFRNAVEHGSPGPSVVDDDNENHPETSVCVRLGSLPEGFYVADDGPGVPQEERDAVFDAGHSTAANGSGFGLAIVQEIVEAHGWTIDLTESESGGARFEITGVDLV